MHFIARCDRYPQFAFWVQPLHHLLMERQGTKDASCWVRFQDRVLDTQAQGWSEQEASIISETLKKLTGVQVSIDFSDMEGTVATAERVPLDITIHKVKEKANGKLSR